jgi:outer membrane cobalamin receptor
MRLLPTLVLLALFPATVLGQGGASAASGTVQGRVVADATGAPLADVGVAVRSVVDSSVVAATRTGEDGRFRFTAVPPGRYRVEASRVGYAPYTSEARTLGAATPAAELGEIRLRLAAVRIAGIEVTAERSEIVVAPDRDIYSLQNLPVASGGTATEALQSVPELEVDINGEVSLRGATPQIYLNGRPAPMQGESLAQFLQQFPADQIDRIEVIANPSARFEAEGAGGIVNIVLKKDAELGLHGNAFVNGGTRGDVGTGGRLTYQHGRVTVLGGGFVRFSQRADDSYSLRQNLAADPITFLEQDGTSERNGRSVSGDLTTELRVGERGTLWAEGRLDRQSSDMDRLTAYTHLDETRTPVELYDRASLRDSHDFSADVSLGYRHVIQPERHELDAELRYEPEWNGDESRVRKLLRTLEGDYADLPVEWTLDDGDESESELAAKLDYVRPWGETGQLEVGYRGEVDDTDNGQLRRIFPDVGAETPISSRDLGFGHREVFNSAYVTLSRRLGKLSVQGGVRAERADTRLTLPSSGESYENDYASLFPSAHLTYDLDDGRRVRFSYSRRIRRPRAWVLNPTDRSTDPLNREIGNPDIDPQYTNSLSLEMSWSGQAGTLRFTPYYRRTIDDWARIRTVDAAGVSTETWENLASIDAYGSSLTASLRRVHGISGHVSVSGSREVRDASNLATDYSGSSMRWSARGNLSARVTSALSLQTMLFYQPAREVAQGRTSSTVMTHLGLRQQVWDGKASIHLMLTDPLGLYRSSFVTRDPTLVQTSRSRPSVRQARLSISDRFGGGSQRGSDRDGPGRQDGPRRGGA